VPRFCSALVILSAKVLFPEHEGPPIIIRIDNYKT